MKITVLGAGNMGLSFAKSFIKYELVKAKNLQLIIRNPDKKNLVLERFPESVVSTFDEVYDMDCDLLILAVKPQDFNFVTKNLPFKIPEKTLVLSIMAGMSIEKIQTALQHPLVVRAMPNSPTLIGMGVTGYTAAKGISFNQLIQVERLLNATGRSVYLEEEHLIDSVTALSGSGPAYFYSIVDAMIKAGMKMGIDENLSKLFVQQTMLGAYHLLNGSERSVEDLIKDVASKGGTTEAALKVFEEKGLREIIQEGIYSAERRSKELNT